MVWPRKTSWSCPCGRSFISRSAQRRKSKKILFKTEAPTTACFGEAAAFQTRSTNKKRPDGSLRLLRNGFSSISSRTAMDLARARIPGVIRAACSDAAHRTAAPLLTTFRALHSPRVTACLLFFCHFLLPPPSCLNALQRVVILPPLNRHGISFPAIFPRPLSPAF